LETPNYTIDRLKHDDPRLEDTKASYAMADEPATETPYQQQKGEQPVAAKPRQEAVVKGITPTQPAPISARPAETTSEEKGFFAKLLGFLGGEKKETPAAASTSAGRSSDRGDRNNRGRGGRNDRNNRGQRDGNRDGNREPREPREPRESRQRGDNDQRKDGDRNRQQQRREPRVDINAVDGVAAEPKTDNRQQRNDRRPKQERGDRAAERAPTDQLDLLTGGDADAASAEAGEQVRSGRRRRRGRGGRGGNGREDADQQTNRDAATPGDTVPSPDVAGVDFTSDVTTQAIAPAAEPSSPMPASSVSAPLTVAVPIVEPIAAPIVIAPIEVAAAPAAVATPAPAATPATPAAPAVPEASQAPAAPAPIKISEDVLKQNLDQVGLQWVQTDPNKAPAEAVAEPPPKLGRAPRRNTETAPQEPLVMVETRQNNP
jgi:ribonuclease E